MKNAGTTRPWKTVRLPSLSCHKHFAAVPILQVPGAKKLAAGFPGCDRSDRWSSWLVSDSISDQPVDFLSNWWIFDQTPVSTVEPKVTWVGGLRCTHHLNLFTGSHMRHLSVFLGNFMRSFHVAGNPMGDLNISMYKLNHLLFQWTEKQPSSFKWQHSQYRQASPNPWDPQMGQISEIPWTMEWSRPNSTFLFPSRKYTNWDAHQLQNEPRSANIGYP